MFIGYYWLKLKKSYAFLITSILILHCDWVLAYSDNTDFIEQSWEMIKTWLGYILTGATVVILLAAGWSCFQAIRQQWQGEGNVQGAVRTVALAFGLATIALLVITYAQGQLTDGGGV